MALEAERVAGQQLARAAGADDAEPVAAQRLQETSGVFVALLCAGGCFVLTFVAELVGAQALGAEITSDPLGVFVKLERAQRQEGVPEVEVTDARSRWANLTTDA